jgi:hypothetical protein
MQAGLGKYALLSLPSWNKNAKTHYFREAVVYLEI